MRTASIVDDDLLRYMVRDMGTAKKEFTDNEALRAFVQARKRERLKALSGKITIVENWRDLEEAELAEAGPDA